MTDLDQHLLDAHGRQNASDLVALYTEAAASALSDEAAGFYLTQAYVFALECGHPDRANLRARLKSMGREA